MRSDKALQRDHECRHAAFHVGRTTPVKHAVANFRCEWIAGPSLARTGWYHIGMPQQDQHRAVATAMRREQVIDLA
jgi:hypothetical protein